MTVTGGPRGSSVVRDWNVAEEDYYCDLLNQSFTKELRTQRETEEEEEEEGELGLRVDGRLTDA